MASTIGKVGSFNRTIGVRLDMDEAIRILPVDEVPLQRWLPSRTTNSIKVEWMEEGFLAQTATSSAVSGTGPWVLTVPDGGIFRVGDVIRQVSATLTLQWSVSSISTNALTVAGFGGNATGPTAVADYEIVGQFLTEGDDPKDARSQERTAKYNYTQIGQEKVEASRTARKRAMYAQEDPYDHELAKKFRELAIRFERQLVLGLRSEPSAGTRSMGGLFYFITTNSSSGNAAAVKTTINDAMRKAWNNGGTPSVLMCSPAVKVAISANTDTSTRRWDNSSTVGGYVVEKLVTDFGEVDIIVNRYFPTTKALVLQRDSLANVTFDGYHHELLAKTGDADKGQIVGEFSLLVKDEQTCGQVIVTDAA